MSFCILGLENCNINYEVCDFSLATWAAVAMSPYIYSAKLSLMLLQMLAKRLWSNTPAEAATSGSSAADPIALRAQPPRCKRCLINTGLLRKHRCAGCFVHRNCIRQRESLVTTLAFWGQAFHQDFHGFLLIFIRFSLIFNWFSLTIIDDFHKILIDFSLLFIDVHWIFIDFSWILD